MPVMFCFFFNITLKNLVKFIREGKFTKSKQKLQRLSSSAPTPARGRQVRGPIPYSPDTVSSSQCKREDQMCRRQRVK